MNARLARLLPLCLLAAACTPPLAQSAAGCADQDLAQLEAQYVAEVYSACKAEGATYDTCKARPAIQAKYRARRASYVECQS